MAFNSSIIFSCNSLAVNTNDFFAIRFAYSIVITNKYRFLSSYSKVIIGFAPPQSFLRGSMYVIRTKSLTASNCRSSLLCTLVDKNSCNLSTKMRRLILMRTVVTPVVIIVMCSECVVMMD